MKEYLASKIHLVSFSLQTSTQRQNECLGLEGHKIIIFSDPAPLKTLYISFYATEDRVCTTIKILWICA